MHSLSSRENDEAPAHLPDGLRRRLEAVRRRQLWLALVRGFASSVATAAMLLGALLLVAAHVHVPAPWRLVGIALAAAVVLVQAARLVGPIVASPPTLADAARLVERRFPELDDRVISAVEVFEGGDPRTYSPTLARAAALDAERAVRDIELPRTVDAGRARRALQTLVLALVFCAGVGLVFPDSLGNLLAGQRAERSPGLPPPQRRHEPEVLRQPPMLTDVTLTLTPPAYSGLTTRTLADDFAETSALVGTRATVSAIASEGGEPVLRIIGPGEGVRTLPMRRAGDAATVSFTVREDVEYGVAPTPGEPPPRTHRIVAIQDEPPTVEVVEPGRDLTVTDLQPIRLTVEASDDFGVARLELRYRAAADAPWQTRALNIEPGEHVVLERLWDLSPLEPKPGDVVAYDVRAVDNNSVTGPSLSASRTYTIRIAEPELAQATRRLEETQEAEQTTLEELRDRARELSEQLREMAEGAAASGPDHSERLARLQQAVEDVDRLGAELDRAIAENMRQMAADKFVTPEMMQKVGEMHRLLQQTLNQDMRKALDRIAEAMQKLDPEALRRALTEAQFRQEDFLRRLDQTIELLKRAHLEQRLERASRLAEQLVRREEQIRDDAAGLARKPPSERTRADESEMARTAGRQEQTRRDALHLLEEMKALSEDLREPNADLSERLGQIAQQAEAEGVERSMADAAKRLRKRDPAMAAVSADEALKSLRDLSARLSQAQADQLDAFRRRLTEAFRRFTRDALEMSRQQEDLINPTETLAHRDTRDVVAQKETLERLGRDQSATADAARAMAGQLDRLSKQTHAVDPTLARRAALIGEMAQQAARDIEGASPGEALRRQRRVMAALNQLAGDLMQAAQRAATASQSLALEQYIKQLEAMAQQQSGLNDQTQRMLGEHGELKPGPGSLGQLALEQQIIRRALERLLQQSAAGGRLRDQLGNVPAQMQDVEEDLEQVKADRETLKTQGEILRKMLDAKRALRTKSERPERKAVQAKPYETPPSPPELTEAQQRKRPAPPVAPEGPLPLDFEDLVRRYFEDLARSQAY